MVAKGDRVRMVQTRSTGVVVSETPHAGADGGPRVWVLWDGSGKQSDWNPGFLRPESSRPEDDPDEVICGQAGRRRWRSYFNAGNVLVIVPEGFFRVQKKE